MIMTSDNPTTQPQLPADVGAIAVAVSNNLSRQIDSSGIAKLEVQGLKALSRSVKNFEIALKPVQGELEKFSAVVSKSFDRYGLLRLQEQLASQAKGLESVAENLNNIVITGFMPPAIGEELKTLGVSFADSVGNIYLKPSTFPMLVDIRRTNTDPYRERGRPLKSLKGEPSALVVRGLVDLGLPIRVSELIDQTGVSRASAYRTLDFCESNGLIERSAPGVVQACKTRDLLEQISQESGFSKTGTSFKFIAPRGIEDALEALKKLSGYAITGSVAAGNWYPYAEAKNLFLYSDQPQELAKKLGLMATDSGSDVVINRSSSQVVYQRMSKIDKLQFVAPSQIVIDLLGGPGRNPEEGKALLNWMVKNESTWRPALRSR